MAKKIGVKILASSSMIPTSASHQEMVAGVLNDRLYGWVFHEITVKRITQGTGIEIAINFPLFVQNLEDESYILRVLKDMLAPYDVYVDKEIHEKETGTTEIVHLYGIKTCYVKLEPSRFGAESIPYMKMLSDLFGAVGHEHFDELVDKPLFARLASRMYFEHYNQATAKQSVA